MGLFVHSILEGLVIDEKLVYDKSSNDDSEKVEILFIPYLDDNEIWFTYEDRAEKGEDENDYPKVLFSSFIYNKEEQKEYILVRILD